MRAYPGRKEESRSPSPGLAGEGRGEGRDSTATRRNPWASVSLCWRFALDQLHELRCACLPRGRGHYGYLCPLWAESIRTASGLGEGYRRFSFGIVGGGRGGHPDHRRRQRPGPPAADALAGLRGHRRAPVPQQLLDLRVHFDASHHLRRLLVRDANAKQRRFDHQRRGTRRGARRALVPRRRAQEEVKRASLSAEAAKSDAAPDAGKATAVIW